MPIPVKCACGASYHLKDEYAGKVLRCPECGAPLHVGQPHEAPALVGAAVGAGTSAGRTAAAAPATSSRNWGSAPDSSVPAAPDVDPVFGRDKFLLQQKVAINEKYSVSDEHGQPLLFVERPTFVGRRMLAIGAAMASVFVWSALMSAIAGAAGKGAFGALLTLVMVAGYIPVALAAFFMFEPKRHVGFYRDEQKSELLMEVEQDQKFQFLQATYTIRDADGRVLANLRKNNLFDVVRKRWYCDDANGRSLCVIKEDSILLSLLRRLLGPLFGVLRTNFVFVRGERVIGEFNRKLTLLDRYVLDMSADRGRTLDRRVALAAGVMLDTGERR